MNINKDTKVCISISSSPGNTGATIHNILCEELSINMIYKPVKVVKDLDGVFGGIRSLGIHGCSVSMPFKRKSIDFVDWKSKDVIKTGCLNTILNERGILRAWNTDVYGFSSSIRQLIDLFDGEKSVLVLGAGATAESVLYSLSMMEDIVKVTVWNRTQAKAVELCAKWSVSNIESIFDDYSDIIINCTSVGMDGYGKLVDQNIMDKYKAAFDVVNAQTPFICFSERSGIPNINGKNMAILQSLMQFRIYSETDYADEELLNILVKRGIL